MLTYFFLWQRDINDLELAVDKALALVEIAKGKLNKIEMEEPKEVTNHTFYAMLHALCILIPYHVCHFQLPNDEVEGYEEEDDRKERLEMDEKRDEGREEDSN